MRNVSPTHIKTFTADDHDPAKAMALLEASFLAWSKDSPHVSITNAEHQIIVQAVDGKPPYYVATLVVMYDLAAQADAVGTLLRDLDATIRAYRSWLDTMKAADGEGKKLTIVDMQIHLAQPMAQLLTTYRQVREW